MDKTVGVVREKVRRLKTGVFSFNAESIKNANKIYKINNINHKKDVSDKNASLKATGNKNILLEKIYNEINKRIDCLAKVRNRVMQIMQVMHKDNICTKLLQNSLSFLRVKDKFA